MQKVTRWGNSVGVRLPKSVLEAAGLQVGGYCVVRCTDAGEVLLTPVSCAQERRVVTDDADQLPADLTPLRKHAPPGW